MRRILIGALVVTGALMLPAAAAEGETPGAVQPESDDLWAEFKQLLPRGQIASVDEPSFVPAEDAEIADEAWVLGVEIDGVARAYSLNLLNRHEIVNDRIGENPIAAVW